MEKSQELIGILQAILINSLPIYIPSVSLNMIFFPCAVADAISAAIPSVASPNTHTCRQSALLRKASPPSWCRSRRKWKPTKPQRRRHRKGKRRKDGGADA